MARARVLLPGAWRWARSRLFTGPLNSLLTIAVLVLLARGLAGFVDWAVVRASLRAVNARQCEAAGGACWAFIADWLRFILFGRYPYAEQWRPALVLAVFAALLLVSFARLLPARVLAAVWVIGLAAVLLLMHGGVFGMPVVETE